MSKEKTKGGNVGGVTWSEVELLLYKQPSSCLFSCKSTSRSVLNPETVHVSGKSHAADTLQKS